MATTDGGSARRVSRWRKMSLNPAHWHQVRPLLAAEAVLLAVLGVAGLVFGAGITTTASIVLLALAIAAAVSATRRRFALLFCTGTAVAALMMVIICAVSAVHGVPGPLGFSTGETLVYAFAFVFHFGLAVWLVPDRIEGPEYLAQQPDSTDVVRNRPGRGTP